MSVDYIVSSLPALDFDAPSPLSWEHFLELTEGHDVQSAKWDGLECELRNAMAAARGGDRFRRPTDGCSLYWKNRVTACFQEHDVAKREAAIDRVWWDAAAELTDVSNPLGLGALRTYAVRLKIALKRSKISVAAGNAAFDRLTAETKRD